MTHVTKYGYSTRIYRTDHDLSHDFSIFSHDFNHDLSHDLSHSLLSQSHDFGVEGEVMILVKVMTLG